MILLAVVGCSSKPPTEHHILPVGFSGVYKIEKVNGHSGGYKINGIRYIFTIPESGVLRVASDVFASQCLACNGLTATFADGQEIPLFSSITHPPDSKSDSHMLLGLFNSGDAIWYAVGTHEQLSRFLEKVQRDKYQKLEQYLPPNKPFQR
jgi:hypothetical protein